MALTTEEAAVNTALAAYVAAVEALIGAKSAGDIIHFVPLDEGDSTYNDHSHAQSSAGVTTSYSQRFAYEVRGDGEFPIQLPVGHDGALVPMGFYVTNQANDLS